MIRVAQVGRVRFGFEWRDLWVGVFIGPDAVYVCTVPGCVIRIAR